MDRPRGYGTVTEGGYTKHDELTAERLGAAAHSLPNFSRNGEDSITQTGKTLGNEKGSPQVDRTGAWAEMPMLSGFFEG